ncbi:ZIP domain-containing protein, putative [Babesia caballi]|uniref:ZIP domain-containing protein, putative n=1 Tax=Babesia caballi TaxID=5871 RepID=A0AAV4M166_BABCB|nr:ZIP domain-containing protein, putative [Babesia caballi]
MVALQKVGVAAIILVETLVFCYAPEITKRLSIYSGALLNEKTLNNATSGALLSLALTHLLPEGFGKDGEALQIKGIDIRGFIMGVPIVLLVTIDILAGHHCGSHALHHADVTSLGSRTNTHDIEDDIEHMHGHTHKTHVDLSHVRPYEEQGDSGSWTDWAVLSVKLKQLFTSRALYLLLTFYVHSILEGALIGTQKSAGSLWGMAFGICAHKWAECLVLNTTVTHLIQSHTLRNSCSIAFALCVPVGMFFGSLIDHDSGPVHAFVQLLAIGFFLHLSFELLTHHGSASEGISNFSLWASYFIGAVVMASVLLFVETLEHDGDEHKEQSTTCPASAAA